MPVYSLVEVELIVADPRRQRRHRREEPSELSADPRREHRVPQATTHFLSESILE